MKQPLRKNAQDHTKINWNRSSRYRLIALIARFSTPVKLQQLKHRKKTPTVTGNASRWYCVHVCLLKPTERATDARLSRFAPDVEGSDSEPGTACATANRFSCATDQKAVTATSTKKLSANAKSCNVWSRRFVGIEVFTAKKRNWIGRCSPAFFFRIARNMPEPA